MIVPLAVLSSSVRTENDPLVNPAEIRAEVGFVPTMNEPLSVTLTFTVMLDNGAWFARSLKVAVCPSSMADWLREIVIVGGSSATVT